MARRTIVFVACLALQLAAIGAWWILRREPRARDSGETSRAPPRAPANEAAPPVAATAERAPEPAAASPAVAAAEQLARELGLELASGPADGPVLIAVEEGTGRPIAGVLMIVNEYRRRVSNLGPSPPPRPPHRLDFLTHPATAWLRLAYVTGDDGRVHVPKLGAYSLIVAYHPSFHASKQLREQMTGELRIEMAPTKSLRLRVVDGAGHPRAGIPIEFTEPDRERRQLSPKVTSRDDGMVELHPFEFAPPARGIPERVRVALALPLADAGFGVERLIDPKHLPDEPIELTLPATGTLAIRVVDGAGLPLRDASSGFEAGIAEAGDARDPGRQIALTRRARGEIPLKDGAGELAPVGVDLAFELNAYSVGRGCTTRIVRGPRTDGERIEVVLPLVNESPTVSGRIVDPTGAPCRKSRVMIESLPADARIVLFDHENQDSCTTDAEGCFRIDRSVPKSARTRFRFTVVDNAGQWSRRGERELEAKPAGPLELGDVVVEPVGVMVAGTVVDRAGAPVEGARLAVSARRRGDGREFEAFEELPGLGAESGADGHFEIRGPQCDEGLQLGARADFMSASDAIPITSGQRDVRVVLERRRLLEIATQLDDGVPPSAVFAQIRPNSREPWRWEVSLAADATLTVAPAWDGATVDLRFFARGLERDAIELAIVPNLPLIDDGTTRELRLDPVDLRGRLAVTRLLLRDGDGRPVADAAATLWIEPNDVAKDAAKDGAFEAAEVHAKDALPGPSRYRGSPSSIEGSADGVLTLVAARAGLPVEVTAPGFLPQRIETTAGERELVLVRSAHVRIEVEEAWAVSNLPYHLRAALIPEHADAVAAATPTRALQSGYALDAPVAGPGRCRVRVTVARLLDDGRLLERELTPKPAMIDVGDPPTRLPIEVHVDAEVLRKLDPDYRPSK